MNLTITHYWQDYDAEAPYYTIWEMEFDEGDITWKRIENHHNIVPAARRFDEIYGLWGGS